VRFFDFWICLQLIQLNHDISIIFRASLAKMEAEYDGPIIGTPKWFIPVRIAQIVLSLLIFVLSAAVLGLVGGDVDGPALALAVVSGLRKADLGSG
jgi:hypothetical protein